MALTDHQVGAKESTPADPRATVSQRTSGPRLSHRIRRDKVLLAMMLPGVLYFLVFQYAAMAGNVIAFENYVPYIGVMHSQFVGLANFQALFSDPTFWSATLNTVELALLQLVFFVPVPLALALLLHSLLSGRIRKFIQSVVFLPHFISWVIVVALVQEMIGPGGVIDNAVSGGGHPVLTIFGDPSWFKPLMVAEVIWKDCGWATIIFTAALFQVDEQLYESAAMDGAGPWRRFWHVTLPGVRPVLVLVLIMRIGSVLTVGFDQVMQQRDVFGHQVAEVLDTYVFFHATVDNDWSTAAAAGLFKGVVGLVLVLAANKVAHRLGEGGVYQ
ncbi:ABC transporter permease [Streptacidiphilus sp. MAP5-3]|uniref:ABC transporter permease n=1 Tax=unclassified Streptacidiphilus TaxID=2643834 RepID=UPI00351743C5